MCMKQYGSFPSCVLEAKLLIQASIAGGLRCWALFSVHGALILLSSRSPGNTFHLGANACWGQLLASRACGFSVIVDGTCKDVPCIYTKPVVFLHNRTSLTV